MSYTWVPSSICQGLPAGNFCFAGNDSDGSSIYVGRACHEGDLIPAKVIPCKKACYVSHGGKEISKPRFELLSGTGFTWVPSCKGQVPAGAVLAGKQVTGEPLYVGRAYHEGSMCPGKIHVKHGCLYIAYGGKEHSIANYEVLVSQRRAEWVQSSAREPTPPNAVFAGSDSDGSSMYVGRVCHEGDLLPAKVIPSKSVAYVSFDGKEIAKYCYEVLCHGNVQWIQSGYGQVLPNAIPGGVTRRGETLYIGRARHAGALTPGKIHPSHKHLYISYNGEEIGLRTYEILVEN